MTVSTASRPLFVATTVRMSRYLDPDPAEAESMLRAILTNLDGDAEYLLVVSRAPDGATTLDTPEYNPFLMQAAGSSESMTIEVRLPTMDGAPLFVIGRAEPPGELRDLPLWDDNTADVYENEIFTADQAADVVLRYYRTETVTQPYRLRPREI